MAAIPISLLTGFLGSGKTTLLRRLLAHPGMADTAVVVNELGEVGLDHLLLREISEDIVLLDSGCLCCAVRDDLVDSLLQFRDRSERGDMPRFKRVVIETTGLADPVPIIHTLIGNNELVPHYRLTGVIATIDATLGMSELDRHPEAVKQAAMADRLVITKSELAPERCTQLSARLRALNPGAEILTATLDSGPGPDALFDVGLGDATEASHVVTAWLNATVYAAPAQVRLRDDDNRHDERIASFCLYADRPLQWTPFVEWLELLLASRGENVLRVKGLLNLDGQTTPTVIQGVQHVVYPPTQLPSWPDQDHRTRLVFITRDLSRTAVENSFRAVFDADALA